MQRPRDPSQDRQTNVDEERRAASIGKEDRNRGQQYRKRILAHRRRRRLAMRPSRGSRGRRGRRWNRRWDRRWWWGCGGGHLVKFLECCCKVGFESGDWRALLIDVGYK